MEEEYSALIQNKKWILFLPTPIKISLIANGYIVSNGVLMVLLIGTRPDLLPKVSNNAMDLTMRIILALCSKFLLSYL
jgi:hypothetical protein